MNTKEIDINLYNELKRVRIITENEDIRTKNVGNSDYSRHVIQPWSIWIDYNLNPWDADIVKRILRTKEGQSREEDYEKIIHICNERLAQLRATTEIKLNSIDFTSNE